MIAARRGALTWGTVSPVAVKSDGYEFGSYEVW
jgi:hypothetical protein